MFTKKMEPLWNLAKCAEINVNLGILCQKKSPERPFDRTWRARFQQGKVVFAIQEAGGESRRRYKSSG